MHTEHSGFHVAPALALGLALLLPAAAAGGDEVPLGAMHPWHVKIARSDLHQAWARLRAWRGTDGKLPDPHYRPAGHTYYLSPQGNDAGPGTQHSPWATLTAAAKRLEPGDTLLVRGGTYKGENLIRCGGTAESPIVIKAAPGEHVLLTYLDSGPILYENGTHYRPVVSLEGCRHLEFSGFEIRGVLEKFGHEICKYSENGISVGNGSGDGVRILDNEIHHCGHCGIKTAVDKLLVEGNLVYDIGHPGAHDHGIYCTRHDCVIQKNIFLNCNAYGIHMYSAPERCVVRYNIAAGCFAYGIILAGPDTVCCHNVTYLNKTGGLLFYREHCQRSQVLNNIFYEQAVGMGFDCCGDQHKYPRGNTADFNCAFPTRKLFRGVPPEDKYDGGHSLAADPQCAAPEKLDFGLLPGSPCIGRGKAMDGPQRGVAPDIGIFATH